MWVLAILFLPIMVLFELTKPKNLYSGGWYSKKRRGRRRK